MKRMSSIIIAAVLIVLMSGCGNNAVVVQTQPENENAVQTQTAAVTEAETADQAATADQTQAAIQEEAADQAEAALQTENDDQTENLLPETDSKNLFTNLEIEVSEGTITVRSGETFSLTRHNGKEVDYEISGDTLYVKASRQDEVVLVLPENESYGALRLTVKNGHAYTEGSVTVESLSLEVNQGEAAIEGISVLEESYIKADGGSASVHGDPGITVTADCQQGHLSLAVPFQESDGNYEVKVSGGNIHLGSHNYNGRSASHTIDNSGERSMHLSCTHGDLSVEFER